MKKKVITPSKFSTLPERKKRLNALIKTINSKELSEEEELEIKKRLIDYYKVNGAKKFDDMFKLFNQMDQYE